MNTRYIDQPCIDYYRGRGPMKMAVKKGRTTGIYASVASLFCLMILNLFTKSLWPWEVSGCLRSGTRSAIPLSNSFLSVGSSGDYQLDPTKRPPKLLPNSLRNIPQALQNTLFVIFFHLPLSRASFCDFFLQAC